MRKNEVEATNQQLFLEPEWAIDSEAIRARGIIVLEVLKIGQKYRE